MGQVSGSLGTSGSLALRLGQTLFSALSLFFMCLHMDFYTYTAFCFLVTVMGLVVPWSVTLALLDAYYVFVKSPARHVGFMALIVIGDSVLAFLSLAAATSTASVAQLLLAPGFLDPSYCPINICSRYPLSAAMAFFSSSLSITSSLFNIWVLHVNTAGKFFNVYMKARMKGKSRTTAVVYVFRNICRRTNQRSR